MRSDWREVYEPGPVPRWLESFAAEPRQAVDALLWQRFHHGPFQAAEPQDLLADWMRDLGSDLTDPLDVELVAWVGRQWETFPDNVPPARLAGAWSIVADAVAWTEGLKETAAVLRGYFDQAPEYLGLLSTAASRDPLGRLYGAVAAHQHDRTLAPFWWRLASLPEGTPEYHARYALEGLRGLPAPEGELETGYRPESVRVLGRLARGFARRAAVDSGNSIHYERTFLALGRLHLESLPLPGHWKRDLGRELSSRAGEAEWLTKLVPDLKPSPVERPNPAWAERAQNLSRSLRRKNASALEAAESLLDEQRRYAQTTGEADEFLVRTLCSLAKTVWQWRPEQAASWAREALDWAPWNDYPWNILLKSFLFGKRPAAAVEVGWQAVERFPENAIVRTNLAEALKAAGRLEASASVYRETIEFFPDDAVARTGLAETLRSLGDLEASASVYRETMELFPTDLVARNGLAGVLVEQGDWEGAEVLYSKVLDGNPTEKAAAIARTGLRTIEHRRAEKGSIRPSAPPGRSEATAPETAPQAGEARVWRRQARRSAGDEAIDHRRRATELLDAILEKRPHEPRALVEQVLLALDEGDAECARQLLDGSAALLPAAPALLAAASRLERELARAESRPLDGDNLQEVLAAPHRLRDLDASAFTPLVHLQESRALLALGGGAPRLEIAARHLDRLRQWTAAQPQGGGDFAGWWAARAAEHALDGKAMQSEIETGDVEILDAWQRERGPELDALEEDYCIRQAALRSEPQLPESS